MLIIIYLESDVSVNILLEDYLNRSIKTTIKNEKTSILL